MAADSICAEGEEQHEQVHKAGDGDAEAPAQDTTSGSIRADDEEEEGLEDEAAAEADVEEMVEAAAEEPADREEWEAPEEEEEEEEQYEEDEQQEQQVDEETEIKEDEEDKDSVQSAAPGEVEEADLGDVEASRADAAEVQESVPLQEEDGVPEEAEEGAEDEGEEAEEEMDEELEEEMLEEEEEEEEEVAEEEEDDGELQEEVHQEETSQDGETTQDDVLDSPPQAAAGRQWGKKQAGTTPNGVEKVREVFAAARYAAEVEYDDDEDEEDDEEEDEQEKQTSNGATREKAQASRAGASADARKPAVQANGRGAKLGSPAGARPAEHADAAASTNKKHYAQLEEENRVLRVELGQANYKITRLNKLREQAAESSRRELLARQNEARAIKELDLAKEYVGKRDAHHRNEKAELLLKIKYLEDSAAVVGKEEKNMQEELAEATFFRQQAFEQIEDAQKLTEKWRIEAVEQSKQQKQMEHKLKQMEDKREVDKARLRELATLMQAQKAGSSPAATCQSASSGGAQAPEKPAAAKRVSSGGAQNGKSKVGESSCDDFNPVFANARTPARGSTGLQRQLSAIWHGVLRQLRLEDCSLELEGGCSGAPGRGKGKKSRGGEGSAAQVAADSAAEARQNLVLGALVTIIVGLAVAKLSLA